MFNAVFSAVNAVSGEAKQIMYTLNCLDGYGQTFLFNVLKKKESDLTEASCCAWQAPAWQHRTLRGRKLHTPEDSVCNIKAQSHLAKLIQPANLRLNILCAQACSGGSGEDS
jgi:hypothetical protein